VKLIALAASAVVLCGCAQTDPVYLRHPDGRTVTCGPYVREFDGAAAVMLERGCIDDYHRQGFLRIPSPR
jgi:hypothetical protein